MKVGFKSDSGLERENNEDSFFADGKIGLFVVADGMGGHQSGEVASGISVKVISSVIKKGIKKNGNEICSLIQNSISKANEEIINKANKNSNCQGMGTTLVLILIHENKIYLANIGDSRAYLIRDNEIKQLTQDDSVVAELLRKGEINQEEARNHQLRNVITKALGIRPSVNVAVQTFPIINNDYFLMCSDGLTEMLDDKEILNVVLENVEPQKICDKLVDAANRNGGVDNITTIILQLTD